MTDQSEISSLLASRICHDLVSPVGAIANGADLISEIGGGDVQDEIAMISQSAARASALLQFYRIAFGAAGEDDMPLARGALRAQAEQLLATPKMILDWEGLEGPAMSRAEGRLLFQMLMCARAVAGMRGRISTRLDLEASFPQTITILSLGATPGSQSVNHDFLALLAAGPEMPAITARQIEFAMVHRSAAELGVRIAVAGLGEGARIEAVHSSN